MVGAKVVTKARRKNWRRDLKQKHSLENISVKNSEKDVLFISK